jgi:hypothetical protein
MTRRTLTLTTRAGALSACGIWKPWWPDGVRHHRRKGLATWMKADALATLRLERPDVAFVTTSNAYENYSIRAINQRLGFISTVVWVTAVLAV